MIYFVSLSEDLARGRAGPNRLNDHVGTSMQCGDSDAGEDWTQSPLPPSRCCFLPLGDCKGKAGHAGSLLQTAQVGDSGSQYKHSVSGSPSLPSFLPFFALSSICQALGSVHHAPNLMPAAGTPGWIRFMVLKWGVGFLGAQTSSYTETTTGCDHMAGGQCARWEMPRVRCEASLAGTPVSTLDLLEPDEDSLAKD